MIIAAGAVLEGRYQIEAVIGHGGSGTVFRAWDRVLGEPIAIKVLHADRAREKSWIKRLAREVKVARAIRHPNVCRVFELGQSSGQWFVTMELAANGSLRDLLREGQEREGQENGGKPPRPLAERLADARALCSGLAAIHAVGIIHRDVTPQNVLRMAEGRLVLSDFGLAIEKTDETTIHGGTPNYMPPETMLGERPDQRSDVWQLGVILHEVLFGRRPEWVRRPPGATATMKWPVAADASPVEEELARLCGDCLAPNMAERPPTAMAVVGRLAAAEVARPRTGLQRAWVRARAAGRRHRRTALVAAAVLASVAAARSIQVAARPPLCRASGDKLAGLWDMRAKASVRRAFEQTGRPYSSDTFWTVNRSVENYLASWRAMYTEACEATHVRGEQSSEILDLRMSCLNDRLDGVRALSSLFARADGDIVDNAVSASDALGTLERCADPRLLRAVLPPPEDPTAREEVERIRRGVADAKALHDAGNSRTAGDRLGALVAEARRVDHAPVLAEALVLRGVVEVDMGNNVAADTVLKEAFFEAEAARHDEVKAQAATYLVVSSGRREHFAEADDWALQADATLKRIGGHERMRSWLETHLGDIRLLQGQNDEAITHQRRAAELKERSGAGRGDIAINYGNISIALGNLGRPEEALGYVQRAITDLGKERGAEHPIVAIHISNRGEILAALGRQEEARAAFKQALVLEERAYGKESNVLAYPLQGLGESLLRDGKAEAAVAPLEQALALRDGHESDRALVAESSFSLARALWETNRDRPRAVKLAVHARDVYAKQPFLRPRLDAVDRWLATATGRRGGGAGASAAALTAAE